MVSGLLKKLGCWCVSCFQLPRQFNWTRTIQKEVQLDECRHLKQLSGDLRRSNSSWCKVEGRFLISLDTVCFPACRTWRDVSSRRGRLLKCQCRWSNPQMLGRGRRWAIRYNRRRDPLSISRYLNASVETWGHEFPGCILFIQTQRQNLAVLRRSWRCSRCDEELSRSGVQIYCYTFYQTSKLWPDPSKSQPRRCAGGNCNGV